MTIVEELQDNPSKAEQTLEKAKKMEKKAIKKGYRFVQVTPNSSILVECDKDGNPTKRGQEHIDRHKERFGFVLK